MPTSECWRNRVKALEQPTLWLQAIYRSWRLRLRMNNNSMKDKAVDVCVYLWSVILFPDWKKLNPESRRIKFENYAINIEN